jgi:hypothetical protein
MYIDVEMFENYHDTVDNNDDAEDNMNVNVNDNEDEDDEDGDSDSDDGEESVLDYGTGSSKSDSDLWDKNIYMLLDQSPTQMHTVPQYKRQYRVSH